jgi:hypothetical protein
VPSGDFFKCECGSVGEKAANLLELQGELGELIVLGSELLLRFGEELSDRSNLRQLGLEPAKLAPRNDILGTLVVQPGCEARAAAQLWRPGPIPIGVLAIARCVMGGQLVAKGAKLLCVLGCDCVPSHELGAESCDSFVQLDGFAA